jgi:hypothetical protein
VGSNVTVTVDAQDKTGPAMASAAKGEKTVGDAAAEAAKQLQAMSEKLERANERAQKLAEAEERAAEKARRMAEDLGLLKHQLEENGDASGQLSRKIDRLTTDHRFAAQATDEYRRAANRAASEAREQARAYDRVADNARQAARAVAILGAASKLGSNGKGNGLGTGADISAGFFKGGIGGATSALEGSLGTPVVGPALLAAIAAATIPAASFVGGAAGGAVGLGLGGAGAGAGLAGAWQGDPEKFDAQWQRAINNVAHRWLESSRAFGDELTGDLKEADRTMRDLPVEKVLALSQGLSTPLVQGAGGGITNFANGAVDALGKVSVIVERVGPKLANLGNAAGDALRMISEGSEGGADALGDLVDGIGYVIRATGVLILGFENAYQAIHDFESANQDFISSVPVVGDFAHGLADGLFGIHESSIVAGRSLKETADISGGLSEQWAAVAQAAAETTVQTLALNDALTATRNAELSLADANLAVAQGWLDLKEGLDDGKKSLDSTTQAGIDNQKAILGQVELLERQREQAIATGNNTQEAVEQANAAYDAAIQKLRETARAAGFTDAQVDALLRSYGALPEQVSTEVKAPGLSSALSQGISLGNALNRIDGQTYEAQVIVRYHTQGQSLNAPQRTGGIGHAATGGAQDGMTLVGEEGPEYVRLPRGSMVYPHANTNQMMAQGGGDQTPALVQFRGDDSALWRLFQKALRDGLLTVPANAVVGIVK